MINKQAFLKELQKRIAVLEEVEQQDILAEYAQHIDLRAAGGLTEEEAIRDFGELDQLAAEILRAYHINPSRKTDSMIKTGVSVVCRWLSEAKGFVCRCIGAASDAVKRLGGSAVRAVRRCAEHIKGLFRHGERPKAAGCEKEKNKMETTIKKDPAFSGIGKTAGSAARGVGRLAAVAVRLLWNLFLLFCALPFAGLALVALVVLGVLAVLLIQGYPLAGAALCCLGGALCCIGILGLGSGLIWRRPASFGLSGLVSKTADELRSRKQRKEASDCE